MSAPVPRPDPTEPDDDRATRLREELEHALEHAERVQREHDEVIVDPDMIQEDRDAAARSLEYARRQVESARSAVERLEAGTYGRCETCGTEIDAERLAALIDVTTCVQCAG